MGDRFEGEAARARPEAADRDDDNRHRKGNEREDRVDAAEIEQKRDDQAGESQSPLPRARRKRPAPAGKTKARNLRLMEDVHDRLWLLARQRKQSVSAGCTTCSTGPCPSGS